MENNNHHNVSVGSFFSGIGMPAMTETKSWKTGLPTTSSFFCLFE
jgi:hypothetical protein